MASHFPVQDVDQCYPLLQARYPAAQGVTVLLLEGAELQIASGETTVAERSWRLACGAQQIANRYFRHQPPTPGELEEAIMQIEDQLALARELALGRTQLVSGDGELLRIAQAAGAAGAPLLLTRDAVEQCFERLAQQSLGRPAGYDSLPQDAGFAAALLILREVMHHLDFDSVVHVAP